jgi:small basic protein
MSLSRAGRIRRGRSGLDHEQKDMVANAVATLLCCLKQASGPFRKSFERSWEPVVPVSLFTFRLLVAIAACLEGAHFV